MIRSRAWSRRRRARSTTRTPPTAKAAMPLASPTRTRSMPLDPTERAGTGGADRARSEGKVIVACAFFSRVPERTVTVAFQGPSGSVGSRRSVAGAVAPGASVVPSFIANGPAVSPPGPSDISASPVRSSARCPVFSTVASTMGRPSSSRDAVRVRISKSDGGSPPGPTDRYIRTPTRCALATPDSAFERASAHTTP